MALVVLTHALSLQNCADVHKGPTTHPLSSLLQTRVLHPLHKQLPLIPRLATWWKLTNNSPRCSAIFLPVMPTFHDFAYLSVLLYTQSASSFSRQNRILFQILCQPSTLCLPCSYDYIPSSSNRWSGSLLISKLTCSCLIGVTRSALHKLAQSTFVSRHRSITSTQAAIY